MKMRPAETRHSLLASAVQVPCRTAASVGLRPAAPTIAAITQSAGRLAASISASAPAADLDAGAGKSGAEVGVATLIGDDGKLGPVLHGEFGETRGVAAAGQGHHRVGRWIAADEIEGVLADRAGGAEHRDAAALRAWRRDPDGFGMSGENGHRQRLTR